MTGRNRMWGGLAAVMAAVGFLAGCERGGRSVEAIDVQSATYETDRAVMLAIESDRGTIEVRGEAGRDSVDVTTTIRAHGVTYEAARARLEELELSQVVLDGAIRVVFRDPVDGGDGSAAFVARVPVEMSLDLRGANVDVSVYAIRGGLTVVTEGGSVIVRGGDLERLSVDAGGDVEVCARLDGNGEVHRVETARGSIYLRIPTDSQLRVHAEVSAGGDIVSALPLSGDTDGDEWTATLNSPNATLRLKTSGGQILIGRLHET